MLPPSWSDRLEALAARRLALGRSRTVQPAAGVDFCSNDYLGLRLDPRLAEASADAARSYGAGSGAARLLRGTSPLHEALEQALSEWKGSEACLLFNTGFQANATILPALTGAGDGIFSDALNHASLVDGCRMAKAGGAKVLVYRHLDLEDLESQLRTWRSVASANALALVVTDSVFSMDGDVADLRTLLSICETHGALLMIDEAHATGLLGAGLAAHQGLHGAVPLIMGTLGKALGSAGAFLCCDAQVRDHLVNTCRGFIFSTALPPPVIGAALQGLLIAQAEPERGQRALAYAASLRRALGQGAQPSAIVPVQIGSDRAAVELATRIQARGYDVRAVRPPTVPEGTARLRITTGSHLNESDVDGLLAALKELL